MAKQQPITFEQAAEDMREMYDTFLIHFENNEAIAIVVGLNQSRFEKYLPDIIWDEDTTP
jgi:hypothetical protein